MQRRYNSTAKVGRLAQFAAIVIALQLQTMVVAEPLAFPIMGKIAAPGRLMNLSDGGTGAVLHDGDSSLLAIDDGSVILFFDAVLAFDAGGKLMKEFPHDELEVDDLPHRMARIEAFRVRHDLDTRRTVVAELEMLDLPRSVEELAQRIAQDRPQIVATGDKAAIQNTITRLGEELARGDVRLLESSKALLVGFGPPLPDAQPDVMIAAEPSEPLFLSPVPGAAATNTIGSRLIFAAPDLTPGMGRRLVCTPFSGCGWSNVSALSEVRAEWLRIDKATGQIKEAVMLH